MRILAIETSCDDTGISILEVKKHGKNDIFKILANNTNSQVKIHAEYGGVFPALAKREHQKNLPIIFEKTLKDAKIKIEQTRPVRSREGSQRVSTSNGIDLIAVTYGPGLEPALWTGIVFAKELSEKYNIPIIPVNHMEGHIFSIFPKKGKTFIVENNKKLFPMLSLLVSGGHTELILIKDWPARPSRAGGMKYKKIGGTRDDAAGEAFDKVARMLGLPYPGGPEISKLAKLERSSKSFEFSGPRTREDKGPDHENSNDLLSHISLPRPMMYSKDYDFSFSGLKTAVLYLIRDLKKEHSNILQNVGMKQMIAREFEDAVVEVLIHKTIKAIKQYKIKTLIVGGGVSANSYLQKQMKLKIRELELSKVLPYSVKVHFPSRALTGDNAIMIGIAGYFQYKNKKTIKNQKPIKAKGNLSL